MSNTLYEFVVVVDLPEFARPHDPTGIISRTELLRLKGLGWGISGGVMEGFDVVVVIEHIGVKVIRGAAMRLFNETPGAEPLYWPA